MLNLHPTDRSYVQTVINDAARTYLNQEVKTHYSGNRIMTTVYEPRDHKKLHQLAADMKPTVPAKTNSNTAASTDAAPTTEDKRQLSSRRNANASNTTTPSTPEAAKKSSSHHTTTKSSRENKNNATPHASTTKHKHITITYDSSLDSSSDDTDTDALTANYYCTTAIRHSNKQEATRHNDHSKHSSKKKRGSVRH